MQQYSKLYPLLLIFFSIQINGIAAIYYTRQNGNWNDPNTWSTSACGGAAAVNYPGQLVAGDIVNICNGHTVTLTVSVPNNIASITQTSTTSNTALDIAGFTLTVTGAITYSGPTANGNTNSITVNSGGVLTAASLTMPATGTASRDCFLNISGTGTVTLSGNLTMSGAADRNHVDFGAAGTGLLQVGGDMNASGEIANSGGNATVEFTSAGASNFNAYTFYNLKISGLGTKSLNGNTTVSNNLDITDGTLDCGGRDLTVNGSAVITGSFAFAGGDLTIDGSATINGTFDDSNGAGANNFNGDVTVNGTWNNTGNETPFFAGNLTNNGTFNGGTAAATYTFTGAGKVIDGTQPISIGDATITGTYTNNLASPDYLEILDDLTGAGTLTQGVNSELRIGDEAGALATLTANTDPNTVIYNGTAFQGVNATTYHHLTINKSGGDATLSGATVVNGDLKILAGTLDANNAGENLTVNGTTTISGASSVLDFTAAVTVSLQNLIMDNGSEINRAGGATANVTVNGTFTVNAPTGATVDECNFTVVGATSINSAVTFDDGTASTKRFKSLVTIDAAGSWLSSALDGTALLAFENGILHNGTSFNAANMLFDINSQALNGTGTYTVVDAASSSLVTVTGITLTNNAIVDMQEDDNNTLEGTGTWVQGANSYLYYNGNAIVISAMDASASPNTVNYTENGAQTVYASAPDFDYWDLIISNSNTKTMANSIDVLDDLDITGTAVLATSTFNIEVAGSTFIAGTLGLNNGAAFANLQDVTLSGGTIGNLGAGVTGTVNIATTLLVDASGGTVDNCDFTVSGISTVNGAFLLSNGTGVKTFQEAVDINAGGSWTSTAINTGGNLIFQNGITHDGTSFTACDMRFDTRDQSLNGSGTYTINDGTDCIINVVTFTVTNNAIVDVNEDDNAPALLGTGTWTQGAGSTLNYEDDAITVSTFNASALGNTVSYDDASGGQTIFASAADFNYWHLTAAGASTKTLANSVNVDGNLSISGTAIFSVSAFDMTVAGNWDNSSTNADPFTEGTRTVTFDGSGAQIVINTGDPQGTEFYNFTVANSGNTITMNGDIIVDNQLNWTTAGYIDAATNNKILTINNWDNGDITSFAVDKAVIIQSGAAGDIVINGVNAGETAQFPVAFSALTTDYARVDIMNNDAANTSFTMTQLCDQVGSTGCGGVVYVNDVVDYFWDFTSASTDADVKIYWDASTREMSGFTQADMNLSHFDGVNWDYLLPSGSAANEVGLGANIYSFSANTTSFSGFGGGKKWGPLPIELLSFNAQLNENKVDITWLTTTEINNDYFTVEKTKDGKEFSDVAKVKGADNSSSVREYKTTDKNPHKGISYYRLKQTDFDGKYTYSELVAINNPEGKEVVFTIFPNPSDGKNINVSVAGFEKNEEVLVVLSDMQGKQVFSKIILTDDNGSFITGIDPQKQLPAGMYFIVGSSRNDIYSRKLVIK